MDKDVAFFLIVFGFFGLFLIFIRIEDWWHVRKYGYSSGSKGGVNEKPIGLRPLPPKGSQPVIKGN
jgi:hypothetical protein